MHFNLLGRKRKTRKDFPPNSIDSLRSRRDAKFRILCPPALVSAVLLHCLAFLDAKLASKYRHSTRMSLPPTLAFRVALRRGRGQQWLCSKAKSSLFSQSYPLVRLASRPAIRGRHLLLSSIRVYDRRIIINIKYTKIIARYVKSLIVCC